jgi:hypothetical protein
MTADTKLLTKGRVALLAGALAVVGTAFIDLTDRSPGAGITAAKYARLRAGMTQDEVTAILGCPPGNYTDDRDRWYVGGCDLGVAGYRKEKWIGRSISIELVFVEADGRLESGYVIERPRRSWLDALQ